MDRMAEILRALFRRALREQGRDASALADIIVLRAGSRFGPVWASQFADGYRAWTALARRLLAYCQQRSGVGGGELPPHSL